MGNITREQWLNKALVLIRKHIAHNAEAIVPDAVRVSVSFPGGRRSKKHTIGQCWSSAASKDKVFEIFISPTIDKAPEVLATLIHEAVHATVGLKAGHKAPFKKVAVAAGLDGKMTATFAGRVLRDVLDGWSAKLGPYPHGALDPSKADTSGPKKQSTRLVKCECTECGYVVRTTQKWLATGEPLCPCNSEPMAVQLPENDE